MEELNKKISSDWYHIKEKIDNIPETGAILQIQAEQLTEGINEMRLAVENGIVEYKAKILKQIFNAIEGVKYDSKGFTRVKNLMPSLVMMLFITNMERHLATGKIEVKEEAAASEIPTGTFDLKEIVADIENRIKSDPAAAAKPEIKSILLKVKLYRKELTEFQKLRANIPADKLGTLTANFTAKLQEITGRIHEIYNQLIAEEENEVLEQTTGDTKNPYINADLIKSLISQMQITSAIISTITYALKEGYNTRELLLNLGNKQSDIQKPFLLEKDILEKIKIEGRDASTAKLLKAEVLRLLAKEEAWVIRKGRY